MAYGSEGIDPVILGFGIRSRWVFNLKPRFTPLLPLDRKLDGPQSRIRRYGKEKIFVPVGNPFPMSLLAIPNTSRRTVVPKSS
jgi:hypothetical protein